MRVVDFWVAVVLTAIVTAFTALVDWFVARYGLRSRLQRRVRQLRKSGLSAEDFRTQVLAEDARCEAAQRYSLLLGVDLAAVAIALDTVALGAYLHSAELFPFFSRFDHDDLSLAIPIWVCVFVLHFGLLVVSTAIRHTALASGMHTSLDALSVEGPPSWMRRAARLSASGMPGFAALLTGISVLADAF